MLDNLVSPHGAQGVVEFADSEILRPRVSVKNLTRSLRRVGQSVQQNLFRGVIQCGLFARLVSETLILGADILNHSGQVNGVVRVYEVVVQSGQSVLLHTVFPFLVWWVSLPFDVFIIAPIGYNVKLRVC